MSKRALTIAVIVKRHAKTDKPAAVDTALAQRGATIATVTRQMAAKLLLNVHANLAIHRLAGVETTNTSLIRQMSQKALKAHVRLVHRPAMLPVNSGVPAPAVRCHPKLPVMTPVFISVKIRTVMVCQMSSKLANLAVI